MKVTTNEVAVLCALADSQLRTVFDLLPPGQLTSARSWEGISRSAASLAQKGLISEGIGGLFQITPAGRERLDLIEVKCDRCGRRRPVTFMLPGSGWRCADEESCKIAEATHA